MTAARPVHKERRFERLLSRLGMDRAALDRLLARLYAEVVADARRSSDGAPADACMRPPALPETGLDARITDPAPQSALDARRVIAGQIMQLYLMHAVHRMDEAAFASRVAVVGLERLEAAAAAGKGVFLLNSHFGSGKLAPVILCRLGWTLTSLMPLDFAPLIGVDLGGRHEVVELATTFDLQSLVAARRVLRAGGIVHGTGDGLRGAGKNVRPFLGKQRRFPDSFAFLSIEADAACLPVFVRSDEFGRITLEILAPLDKGDAAAPLQERIVTMLDQYIAILEQRWLGDFGNVPARSVRLFADGWTRDAAQGEGEA